MENPIKMDDLGVPLFLETPIFRGKLAVSFRAGKGQGLNSIRGG